MYQNSGGKIKGVAVIFCVVDIILAFIAAIGVYRFVSSAMRYYSDGNGAALLIAFVVLCALGLLGWLTYLLLYGFGELVENSAIIAASVRSDSAGVSAQVQEKNTQTSSVCPNCGAKTGNEKFCAKCGHNLQ